MPKIIKSRHEIFEDNDIVSIAPSTINDNDNYQDASSVHIIENSDLGERSFIMIMTEDNQRLRVNVVKALETYQEYLNSNPALKYFAVTTKDDTIKEITRCNEILDHIQNQDVQDKIEWCFKHFTSHKCPFPATSINAIDHCAT